MHTILGVGTITDSEDYPAISVSDTSVTEGNNITMTEANFTLTLSKQRYSSFAYRLPHL